MADITAKIMRAGAIVSHGIEIHPETADAISAVSMFSSRYSNRFLSVYRQEREDFCRVKDAVEPNQIVVGVLEANVARAIVDRLDTSMVEQTGIVGSR